MAGDYICSHKCLCLISSSLLLSSLLSSSNLSSLLTLIPLRWPWGRFCLTLTSAYNLFYSAVSSLRDCNNFGPPFFVAMAPLEREEQYYHILYELDHVLLKDQPSSMLKAKQILAMVHSRLAKHEPSTIGKKKRQVKSWSDPNSMISTITYMAKAVRPEYEGMTRKQNKSRSVVYVHGSAALDLTKVFKKYPNYVRDLRDHHQRLKSPQLPAQAPQRPDAATGFASLQSLPFPVKVQTSGLNGMRLVPQPQHQSSATDQDRLDSWNARYTPTQLGNLIHGGTYDVLAGKSADILNGELRELLDHRGGTGNNQLSSDQFENAFKELNSLHHLFFSLFDNTTRSIDGIEAEDLPLLARCLYDIFPGACRSVYGSNSDPETMVKSTQQSRLYLPDIFVALMQASTLQSLADMMPLSWRLARGTRIETYQHYMLRGMPILFIHDLPRHKMSN
jgi:hypothetical protein